MLTYIPVFGAAHDHKDNPMIAAILVFYMVILVTMVYGPIAAFLVEIFPAQHPLQLDVAALPRRQWRVRRRRAVHRGASLAAAWPAIPLVGLYYPIGVAAVGVVVGLFGFKLDDQRQADLGRGRRPAPGARPALRPGPARFHTSSGRGAPRVSGRKGAQMSPRT